MNSALAGAALAVALAGCGDGIGNADSGAAGPRTQVGKDVRGTILDPAGQPLMPGAVTVCPIAGGWPCIYASVEDGVATFLWDYFEQWTNGRPQVVTANVYDEYRGTWARHVELDFRSGGRSRDIQLVSFRGTGTLRATVTDVAGRPLSHALVTAVSPVPEFAGDPELGIPRFEVSTVTDRNGQAILEGLTAQVQASAAWPYYSSTPEQTLAVPQGGTTAVSITIDPQFIVSSTAAVKSFVLDSGWIGPDPGIRRFKLAYATNADPALHFYPWLWGWMQVEGQAPIQVKDASQDDNLRDGARLLVADMSDAGAYSAVLLLDQGERIVDADYYGARYYAAQHFIERARVGAITDQVTVAGFAGAGHAATAPELPQLPVWVAPTDAPPAASLEGRTGGSSPVFDALKAAINVAATQAGGVRTAAVVAYLGGGDDSGLSVVESQLRIDALRAQLDATGVQLILIAAIGGSDLDYHVNQAVTDVAKLAAMLGVPCISEGNIYTSDPYSAFDLAASLLAGRTRTYAAVLHGRLAGNVPWPSGGIVTGRGLLASDAGPWGQFIGDMHVWARIP